MHSVGWSRRTMLLAATLGLGGCALTDPVIHPTDAPANPLPPTPTLSAERAGALGHELTITWLLQLITTNAAAWKAPDAVMAWARASSASQEAHIERLLSADPLLPGDKPDFPRQDPALADPPTSWATAQAALASARQAAVTAHSALALDLAGDEQPLALFYASLAAAASGPIGAAPPVAGTGAPIPFAPATPKAVLPIVLTQVWSLIYALEVGIGRLAKDSQTRAAGLDRLAAAKQIRDDLLARPELATPPPQLPAYDLEGPVGTEAQVRSTWATHELALLGAWGRLLASSRDADAPLANILRQVAAVQHWGSGLPHWPGWV